MIPRAIMCSDCPNDGSSMEHQVLSRWSGDALFPNQDREELQKSKCTASENEMMGWKEPDLFHILEL